MDQKILVGDRLTDQMISVGKELIQNLDKTLPIVGTFWLLLPELNKWRLIIASPSVRLSGPLSTYKKVQSVLKRVHSKIELTDISVISDREPFYLLFKQAISTGPALSEIRFTDNVVNGHRIHDALIYRLS